MLTPFLLWAAVLGQEDELLRVFVYSGTWASVVPRLEGRDVEQRDIAAVNCVGMVPADMFCSWQQRKKHKWRKYSSWADLSRKDDPQLKGAIAEEPPDH